MDEQRKNIIINEITYWKQNRMLPEHYCNYLLNLYTEGGSPKQEGRKKLQNESGILSLILFGLLSLSLFLFYFTELSLILQMALPIILVIISFLSLLYVHKKSVQGLLPLMAAFLLLLIATIQGAEFLFPGNQRLLYGISIANCSLWLASGIVWRITSLKLSGAAGLLIIGITIFI